MSSLEQRFYLIVPDLFSTVEIAEQAGVSPPRLPGIELVAARGERRACAGTLTAMLARFLPGGNQPPAGPVAFYGDMRERPDGWCCRADPVFLEAHMDHLRLLAPHFVRPEPDEARALIDAFNAAFEKDALSLSAKHPSRWYLLMQRALDVTTWEPDSVVGRNVIDFMPAGRDGGHLKALMTEVQMLFHPHEVNARREQRDLPTINSIWIWGGGRLPELPGCALPAAWGSDPYLEGLWALCGHECAQLPAGAAECLSSMNAQGGLSLVAGLSDAWFDGGPESWAENLRNLDRDWCQPVVSALKEGHIGSFHLMTNGIELSLSRGSARRFWRRSKPLTAPGG